MIIKHNSFTLELYDSILETNAGRFQLYNSNVMLDAGVGGDLSGVEARIDAIARMIQANRKNDALTELANMRESIRFVVGHASPELRSFVVLIRKINGRRIRLSDLTEDGIERIREEINRSDIPMSKIRGFLKTVKAKFAAEFELLFQAHKTDPNVLEMFGALKTRTLLALENIRSPVEGLAEKLAELDAFILERITPKIYAGAKGLEVRTIQGFEEACILLRQFHVSDDPRRMSAYSFYQSLELLQAQAKSRSAQK